MSSLAQRQHAQRLETRADEWRQWFDEQAERDDSYRKRPADSEPRAPIVHEDHRYDPDDWMSSGWYTMYVLRKPKRKRDYEKFRKRFRMPYAKFVELVEQMRSEKWFPKVELCNALGQPGVPLSLLVLGALRVLGRSWVFDDVEEATGVSTETHRKFFHN